MQAQAAAQAALLVERNAQAAERGAERDELRGQLTHSGCCWRAWRCPARHTATFWRLRRRGRRIAAAPSSTSLASSRPLRAGTAQSHANAGEGEDEDEDNDNDE